MSVDSIRKELTEKADSGAATLGELVWWGLQGVETLQADVERIVDGLNVRGHDGQLVKASDVCPKIQARGAVQKTLDELNIRSGSARRKAKGAAVAGKTLFARRYDAKSSDEIKAGDFHVVIYEETLAYGAKAAFNEVQRIRYDSEHKRIGLETDLLQAEIHDGFRRHGLTYRASDVGRIISQLIERAHGLMAREAGGVYLIPRQYLDVARACESLCNQVTGASFTRMPILAGSQADVHVVQTRELAGKSIRDELARMELDLASLREQAESADAPAVRGSTVKARLDRFKVLKHKASTYRTLLDLEDSKIKDQINALTQAAKAILALPAKGNRSDPNKGLWAA